MVFLKSVRREKAGNEGMFAISELETRVFEFTLLLS